MGCFESKVIADVAKVTARFRHVQCRDLVRENKAFVKNKANAGNWIVVLEDFGKLLFE